MSLCVPSVTGPCTLRSPDSPSTLPASPSDPRQPEEKDQIKLFDPETSADEDTQRDKQIGTDPQSDQHEAEQRPADPPDLLQPPTFSLDPN